MTTAATIKNTLFATNTYVQVYTPSVWCRKPFDDESALNTIGMKLIKFRDGSALNVWEFNYQTIVSKIKQYLTNKKKETTADTKADRFKYISRCFTVFATEIDMSKVNTAEMEVIVIRYNDRDEFEKAVLSYLGLI